MNPALRNHQSWFLCKLLDFAGDGVQVEGVPSSPHMDVEKRRMGTFNEQFCMEPGEQMGSFYISKQELYIQQ
jgi:hypothetical protein